MYRQISKNRAVSIFTVIGFIVFVGLVGYAVGLILDYNYGMAGEYSLFLLFFALIIAFIASFFSYYYSDRIVISLTRARPITLDEDPRIYYMVEGLSIAAGIPMPRIYMIEEHGMNAFATGRNPANSAVVFTRGLVENLDDEELKGVISHELSHIKNYDVLLGTIIVIFVGMLSIVSNIIFRVILFGGASRRRSSKGSGGGLITLVMLIIGVILIIFAPIIGTIIRFAISRRREYLADSSGALISRYPAGLASALRKISTSSGVSTANSATAHLFIANPFTKKTKPLFSGLFNTHPPVEDRIKRLEKMSLGVGI
jgi:heat shock protein HtpX